MATTPEGTPYVESSDLVANYPAASLSLANRVDLVGVLPFATAAARTTAIPSPTDGQYVYLQDTNTTQFYNGSAWQAVGGLGLVTPTSIANSGGSASVSGGAVTFTGVTSLSLNGVFTSAFDNYRITMSEQASTTSQDLRLKLRVAGSDSSTSYYYGNLYTQSANSTITGLNGSNLTSWLWGFSHSASRGGLFCDMQGPALAFYTSFYASSQRTDGFYLTAQGHHAESTSYDGFTLTPQSGTMTGTIRVYGYQNS